MLLPTLLLLLAAACTDVRAHTDADGYERFTRASSASPLNAYKLYTTRATWEAANVACTRDGGHLLVVDTADEARVARTLFGRVPVPGAPLLDQLHVGITDKAAEGVWKTVLGAPLSPSNAPVAWAPGQPDNAGADEHCGALTRDMLYNDLPCDKLYACPYICEKELDQTLETFDTGASLNEFISSIDVRGQGEAAASGQGYTPRFLAILLRL